MKRIFTLLAGIMLAWSMGATTFTFSGDLTQTQDGITVTLAQNTGSNTPVFNFNYMEMRLYASNTITVTGTGITRIEIVFAKQGSKPYADLTANTGNLASGGASTSNTDDKTDVWTGSASQVVFTMGTGQRVIKSMTVTTDGTTGGGEGQGGEGQGGEGQGGDSDLNPDYNYSEPTIVTVQGEAGSNQSYSFIDNNIRVTTTVGAIVPDGEQPYFGCNAGQSITFTASKAIKALAVNGYVKKDFEATATAGTVQFVDASADAVEANPVLVVTDINATSVTISCVKQMRCYSVAFYFEANPDIELGGEEDEDYSYEWENTEKVTLNLAFDEIETADMSEDLGYACSYIGLANDEYELELDVFATLEANGLPAAGTYPINDSYDPNTVMASVGGTDEFDFPSVLLGDFYEEEGEWYYNSVYYLVGGTMEIANVAGGTELRLNATSYYGSTIKTTYLVGADAVEQIAAEDKALKTIEHGQIIIRRGEQKFNLLGTKID